MKDLLAAVLLFASITLYSHPSFAQDNTTQNNTRFINVSGQAEITVPADQAEVSLQIKTIDKTSDLSKSRMDEALNAAVAILRKTGIENKFISVSPVLFGKNYEFNEKGRQQNGYYSMVTVNVLLKNLTSYFELTNQLSTIEAVEIVSSDYSVADIESHNLRAYESALKAAQKKAESMARTMGVGLGTVLEIDEVIPVMPYNTYAANVKTRAETPDPAFSGKVVISKTVRVKFRIAQ